MATRNLGKVGRALGKTSRDIDISTNRAAGNHPLVEQSNDRLSRLMPYYFEFYTYTKNPNVYIDLIISEKFVWRLREGEGGSIGGTTSNE